jgi:hypothetical protein
MAASEAGENGKLKGALEEAIKKLSSFPLWTIGRVL